MECWTIVCIQRDLIYDDFTFFIVTCTAATRICRYDALDKDGKPTPYMPTYESDWELQELCANTYPSATGTAVLIFLSDNLFSENRKQINTEWNECTEIEILISNFLFIHNRTSKKQELKIYNKSIFCV